MERPPSKRSSYGHFNDEAVDALYRSAPDREWTLAEIAEAAETNRQTIYVIEQRAMRKIREELERRGMYKF